MKTSNRDLLVLVKDENVDDRAMEHELISLNQLLHFFEKENDLYLSYEVIDINKSKIITDGSQIQKTLSKSKLKPFVFVFNRN